MKRVWVVAIVFLACSATAQTRAEILAIVVDKKGAPVAELAPQDLRVTDEGQAVAFDLRRAGDRPVEYVALLDMSNSTAPRFEAQKRLTLDVVRTLEEMGARGVVVAFDTKRKRLPAANAAELEVQLRSVDPGGGTAINDSIVHACQDPAYLASSDPRTRRFVFIVSDGDDNQSRATRRETIEVALKRRVTIVALKPMGPIVPTTRGDRALRELTEKTGGVRFEVWKREDVSSVLRQLLDGQRSISWTAAPAGPEMRRIKVERVGKREIKIFAPEYYSSVAR